MKTTENYVKYDILKKLGFKYEPFTQSASPKSQTKDNTMGTVRSTGSSRNAALKRDLGSACLAQHLHPDQFSRNIEDGYPHFFVISGIPCYVTAKFISGEVEVKVSLPFMTKQIKHEFNTANRKIFGGADLFATI